MNDKFVKTLKPLLDKQLTMTVALKNLMEREYATLNTAKSLGLDEIIQKKQKVIDDLDKLNKNWQQLLAASQVDISEQNIRLFLAKLDPSETFGLLMNWNALCKHTKACQRLNTVNGTVIVLRQHATRQALDILQGKSHSNTYGPKGQKLSNNYGGHSIATV